MHKTNPMLQTPVWTFADMAVAQDWELERGNEGALIWTDLGPELARMVCENAGVLVSCEPITEVKLFSLGSVRMGLNSGIWARLSTTFLSFLCWVKSWVRVGNCADEGSVVRVGERHGLSVASAGDDYE